VTEGSKVIGRPPLVSEAWFTAQVLQSAQNEPRPFSWVEQKPCLHCQMNGEGLPYFRSTWKQLWHKIFVTASLPWARCFCRVVCTAGKKNAKHSVALCKPSIRHHKSRRPTSARPNFLLQTTRQKHLAHGDDAVANILCHSCFQVERKRGIPSPFI
jgi:hypothetical protein